MNVISYLRSVLFLLVFESPIFAQSEWTTLKEKDGIKISSRHSPNSPFNDIRVELDLKGNIDQLEAILTDVNSYKEWSYATKVSRLVKSLGPGKFIYYTEIEVPWPATNRFFYANFELKKKLAEKSMHITAENIPNYQPVPKDLVQVPLTRGTWNVSTVSIRSIHVYYVLEMNPGG